jgi:hypothetical protein
MRILTGKYYRTRDGQKMGPARRNPDTQEGDEYKWIVPNPDGDDFYYTDDGKYWTVGECDYDIIEEWTDQTIFDNVISAMGDKPYTSADAWRDIHTALGESVSVALASADYDKAMEYAGFMRAIEQEGVLTPNNATE